VKMTEDEPAVRTLMFALGAPAREDCEPGRVYSLYDPPCEPQPCSPFEGALYAWLEEMQP